MKVKQINIQSDLILMLNFSRPSCPGFLPNNQILCQHQFNLKSLYFQSSQSLPNSIQLHMPRKPHQCAVHFNEQATRTHFLSINTPHYKATSSSNYCTAERPTKTLHRMSLRTPVSVSAKITWEYLKNFRPPPSVD